VLACADTGKRRLAMAAVRVLLGHTGRMSCVCTAPDGRLVTAASDKRVCVWSLASGAVEATLVGHTKSLRSMCALTDGTNRVVTGGYDFVARLYELSAARGGAEVAAIREYSGHTKLILSMAAVSGGRLATGSMDRTIRVWDVETGACLATLRDGSGPWVEAVAAADEVTLVTCGPEQTMSVWDLRTYARLATVATSSYIFSLLRLGDGTVASGNNDGSVQLWDVRRRECVGELRGPYKRLQWLAQLGDGSLAAVGRDTSAGLWDVARRARLGVVSTLYRLECCCATVDGGLAMGCADGSVVVLGFPWARRGVAVVGWVAARAGVWC